MLCLPIGSCGNIFVTNIKFKNKKMIVKQNCKERIMWLEIFKIGSHTDSNGENKDWDCNSLDTIVNTYNQRIAADKSCVAPVVKGHPQTSDPAYGWVERLVRRGSKILARLKDIDTGFLGELRSGKYKKVSIALYPDLMLRHVGFLGAAAPAVKGLNTALFGEANNGEKMICTTVDFSEKDLTVQLPAADSHSAADNDDAGSFSFNDLLEKIKGLESENQNLRKQIAESEKEARLNEFRQFSESLAGNPDAAVILPCQTDELVDILESAYQSDVNSVAAEATRGACSNVEKIKHFVSSLRPAFSFSEFAVRAKTQNATTDTVFRGKNVNFNKLEIHQRARQFQAENPDATYEEALSAVTKEIVL